MSSAALVLAALFGAAPLRVVVPPVAGAEPAVGVALVGALRDLAGLEVVAALDLPAMLGAETAARFSACADDPCRVAALAALGEPSFVFGALEADDGTPWLRLRRVVGGAAIARASAPLPADGRARTIARLAAELFPAEAAQSLARLVVRADAEGAIVTVDGQTPDAAGELRLPAGRYTVRASAPGHHPTERTIELMAGGALQLELALDRVRGPWPWILAGGAVAAAGAGVAVGAAASGVAARWEGCCGPGLTRAAYLADRDTIAIENGVANGLFTLAGGLLVAAIVTYVFPPESSE